MSLALTAHHVDITEKLSKLQVCLGRLCLAHTGGLKAAASCPLSCVITATAGPALSFSAVF